MSKSTEVEYPRYYTFSQADGRRRVPHAWSMNQNDAINWTKVMFGAGYPDNLVKEEGPSSNPTVTVIWERNPRPPVEHPPVVVAFVEAVESNMLVATGQTPQEALDAVMDAWHTLAREYNLDPDLVHDEDVTVAEGPLGSTFLGSQRLL